MLYDAVARAVASDAGFGGCPVVMSGDCNTSAGIMAGLQRAGADPAIVWFDAHGDVQTLETTTSGYLGGLAFAAADRIPARADHRPAGPAPGARGSDRAGGRARPDPPEVTYLAGAQITRREVVSLTAASLPDGPALRARGPGRDRRGRAARPALPGARRTGRRPARGRAAHACWPPARWPRSRLLLLLVPGPRFCPARRGPAERDPGVTVLDQPPQVTRPATRRTCGPGAARWR